MHHGGSGLVAGEELYLLLDLLGFLELGSSRELHHQLFEAAQGGFEVSLDDVPDLPDVLQVILFLLQPFAGPQAILDMVFQANLVFLTRYVLFAQVVGTGPQGIQLLDQTQQGAGRLHGSVGAVILAAVLEHVPGHEHPGKGLLLDADPGVGLVVLEQHIVFGLVLLDQVVLEQQGICLGSDHDVIDPCDLGHQDTGLAAVVGLGEVGRDPLL